MSSPEDAQKRRTSDDGVYRHYSEVNLPTQCEQEAASSVHGQEDEQEHAPVEASANLPSSMGDGDEEVASIEAGFRDMRTRTSVTEVATDQPCDDPPHQQHQPVDCDDGKQGKDDREQKTVLAGKDPDLLAEGVKGKSEVGNKQSADELEMEAVSYTHLTLPTKRIV